MSLTPESRVMLTDALRPPVGYKVDIALGTTYSLDLTAMLLAPLSFALFDQANSADLADDSPRGLDPIRLLEAVRRHAQHTTVFCQAGGIHVPASYRSILTFVEDSVMEVTPPPGKSLFHPKIWALRFVDKHGEQARHRFVILSRNLTLDRSWDTALVLEEDPKGGIDAHPAADFVRQLPSLCLPSRPLSQTRREQISDLAATLEKARLTAPYPFTEGTLVPVGLTAEPVWPFPERGQRILAISPFLTVGALAAIEHLGVKGERHLLSRPESLDLLGARALRNWNASVLQPVVEAETGDAASPATSTTEFQGTAKGLHAKTFVVDLPGHAGCSHKGGCKCRSVTITGSANLTRAPWGGSVEFDAALVGPTGECGVHAVLHDKAEVPGLGRLLETHQFADEAGIIDAAIETSYEIEDFHRAIAASGLALSVHDGSEETVTSSLTLTVPSPVPRKSETRVWPVSLSSEVHALPLAESLSWVHALINVTPFIAVETTAGEGEGRATRRCVLMATLSGDVAGRHQDAIAHYLNSKEAVLRYLVFLLGDPAYDALFTQLAGTSAAGAFGDLRSPFAATPALFEPLVRATGRDEDALVRVASLVEEIRGLPNGKELVPDGFDELWDVIWHVHNERLQ